MKTKTYPEIGFLRLRDVIGGKDNPGVIPVSRSSWYKGIAEGIAEGRYPSPVKLAERASARSRFTKLNHQIVTRTCSTTFSNCESNPLETSMLNF
jgi:hypothetical protein